MRVDRRGLVLGGLMGSATLAPAQAAPAQVPNGGAPWGVNVKDFGAVGDGATIDTPAVNKAVDHLAARGGGVVHFPAGTYACYTIRLKSNITLHLDPGAVILAATPTGAGAGGYDDPGKGAGNAYQDYGHSHWSDSLIFGENLHDIAIVGSGLIWGRGLTRGHRFSDDPPDVGGPGVGNKSIALKNCRNVLLRDFRILQGGWFALLATAVDNMTIDNLIVDTNRDGLDIDCCRNVRVTNCTVNSPWDDGICPKSSFALGYARSTENVTISNCYLTGDYQLGSVIDGTWKRLPAGFNGTGRIKCGTESNGGFKNIAISNCVFDGSRGIALETVDGALLEDIAISNITMRGSMNSPLFLRLGRRMRGPKDTPVGQLRRVTISNLTSHDAAALPSIIAGIEGHPVEDIHLSDIYLHQAGGGTAALAASNPPANEDQYPEPSMFGDLPATGLFIRHARNVSLSRIEVAVAAPDARPAIWAQDVDGLEAFDIKAPRSTPSGPVFDLRGVGAFRTFGNSWGSDVRFDAPVTQSLNG